MRKYPLIGGSICAVVLIVLLSLSNIAGGQAIQSSNENGINIFNDVAIEIRAGAHNHTNGNYGLGFVICITNNLDINITGSIRTYWNFTDKWTVASGNATFSFSAHHPETQIGEIDWQHFPFPILKLQISVTVNEISKSESRSGIEIGPFVIFSHIVQMEGKY
jgi:hypothetical protein